MDYSKKVKTTATTPAGATETEMSESIVNHRHSSDTLTDAASSPLTSDQQETGTYACPACPIVVTTSRDLTNHLRGHNSPRSTDCSGEDDYSCGVCHKVLSSASSLDRHVLVHSGERPFKCKYCDMAFTTNGNMNRHLRTAHGSSPRETNGFTDSEASSDSDKSGTKRRHRQIVEQEYNNNEIGKSGSTDSLIQSEAPTSHVTKKPRLEIVEENNDNTSGKRHKIMLNNSRTEIQNGEVETESEPVVHNCPVCARLDFPSSEALDEHLERHHPEYPATCEDCRLSFKNYRVRCLHNYMKHADSKKSPSGTNGRNLRNSVVGFNDLTFVDFSADKFPAIARAVCEQSVHRPASGEATKFQCDKCLRAFPCRLALDAHETDCGTTNQPSTSSSDDQSSRRDHFFAGLDLQNTATMNEAKEGKDLADIQSIISVTSGPILQNFPRSDASTPEQHQQVKPIPSIAGSSGSSGTASSSEYHHDEEMEDAFAKDFRRMKLKGEFPCRLCDAVFPNLRALKGHNRSHMGVGPGMPYPCNMCPYTSNDKGTLVRHLRSHNGDRPFECSVCNFAFTTKANCERHVRNRHGITVRDTVKNTILYHPSADGTNDASALESQDCRREDARKSLVYPAVPMEARDDNSQRCSDFYLGLQLAASQNGSLVAEDETPLALVQSSQPENNESSARTHSQQTNGSRTAAEEPEDDGDDSEYEDEENENESAAKSENSLRHRYNASAVSSEEDASVSLVSDTKTIAAHQIVVQTSPMDLKKSSPGSSTALTKTATLNGGQTGESSAPFATGEDAPLDLSMDVLDLSKKSNGNPTPSTSSAMPTEPVASTSTATVTNDEAEVSRNHKEFYDATNQFLLTQALLKAGQPGNPATSLEALYANAHMIYRNFGGFSAAGVGAGILPPYLFNPHMFGQDFAMKDRLQKELVRGLQLTSGGNIVEPPIGNTAFAGAYPPGRELAASRPELPNDFGNINAANLSPTMITSSPISQPNIETNSQSSNSVKMVIKNGVLMPKQKQRRYRTERPFACEHCSARFTLRSNMERHIKQQHPHYWSQRPRGGHSTRGRPPANPPTLLSPANNHSLSQQACNIMPKIGASGGSMNYEKHSISDQVKYAILAQQLKGTRTEENDTDEELIIDEGAHENRESIEVEVQVHTPSLLRGKLEGTNDYHHKENSRSQLHRKASEMGKRIQASKAESNRRQEIHPAPEPMEAEDCSQSRQVAIKTEQNEEEEREHERKDESRQSSQFEGADLVTKIEQSTSERNEDLASVSELLDNASQQYQQFQPQYMSDEEGLVASTSDCNNSGSDEKSDSINSVNSNNSETSAMRKKKKKKKMKKKKSAYSMAPNRVICPYCERPFPWTSSLRRHILTHTGQKPYQCMHCSLLFTTKSNCDRHLLRKHKNTANKIRRMRNSSSPESLEQPSNNNTTNSNNNNVTNTTNNNNNNSSSSAFAMRNVPERPYKCNLCPSSTFSTLGNLKKHKSSKHSRNAGLKSRAESPATSEPRNSPITTINNKQNDQSGYESQSSSNSENMDHIERITNLKNARSTVSSNHEQIIAEPEVPETQQQPPETTSETGQISNGDNPENMECQDVPDNSSIPLDHRMQKNNENNSTVAETAKPRRLSPRSSPGPADTPFKCHLCDSGFSERQDCLDHIRINHTRSYEILVAKGALDMDIETPEEQQQMPTSGQHPSDGEEKRGRFPDYSNRKVVCAFCLRRFWSAEDLRRHMRTHTGERPFSCDICCRRFTLKHSMLRHRKKHESVDSMMYVGTSGDEESVPPQPPTIAPRSHQQSQQQQQTSINTTSCESRMQERMSLPTVATVATGDAAPSGLMRFNHYEKLTTLTCKMNNAHQPINPSECSADTENDLISNLLGIRDKSIIDKVLQASADDAAKLLGVNRHHE